jgi:hypothetical protein
MTVEELIKKLEMLPLQKATIYIQDYNYGGMHEITDVELDQASNDEWIGIIGMDEYGKEL